MKRIMKTISKLIIFGILCLIIISTLTKLLTPKWLEDNRWQSSRSNTDFYEQPKNSMDVLFFGSSVMTAAILPMEIYEKYGFTSYNLATISQPMIGSYFWIKETLKYQKPKVIVLEVRPATRDEDKTEEKFRKSFDYMRWGINKLDFAIEYRQFNKKSSIFYYLFPIMKYHSRWSQLSQDDFDNVFTYEREYNYGGTYLSHSYNKDYNGYDMSEDADITDYKLSGDMNYLKKSIEFCKDNNIQIVLLRTTDSTWSVKRHKLIQEVADEYQVPFIDMNDNNIMNQIGLNFGQDSADDIHLNVRGMLKTSDFVGSYLAEHFELNDKRNEITELQKENYKMSKMNMDNSLLCLEQDMKNYFNILQQSGDRYTAILTCNYNEFMNFTDEMKEALNNAGISEEVITNIQNREKFVIVIQNGTILYQDCDKNKVSYESTFPDGTIYAAKTNENTTIKVNNNDCKTVDKGFNIVVYDNELHKIADNAQITYRASGYYKTQEVW